MFEQLHKRIIEFDSAVDYDFSIDNNPSRLISVGESYEKYNFHLDFIFNVSLQIFHTCTYYIMEDLGEPVNSELVVKTNERMFLIGIPFKEFSEEICLQIQTRKISISTLSLFGRQIVEQIILVSELRKQKIPYENVFIAFLNASATRACFRSIYVGFCFICLTRSVRCTLAGDGFCQGIDGA